MRIKQHTDEELAFAEKLANTPVVNLYEKLLEQATRITELESQLADAKQVANDCRIVADNAIAEALGAKKEAERLRELDRSLQVLQQQHDRANTEIFRLHKIVATYEPGTTLILNTAVKESA